MHNTWESFATYFTFATYSCRCQRRRVFKTQQSFCGLKLYHHHVGKIRESALSIKEMRAVYNDANWPLLLPLSRQQLTYHRPVLSVGLSVCLSVCLQSVTLVYCGQTVGWIKMPLATEVGLSPGHIVLDGDTAPPTERGIAGPHFSAHFSLAWSPISQELLSSCFIAGAVIASIHYCRSLQTH